MNIMLNTDSPMNTFCLVSGLTHTGDILTHSDIFNDALLAVVFSDAPCSVCVASDQPTVGPTFFDCETGGQFCLGCLELACEPLEDAPEELELEDPEIVAYAEEWIASRRAAPLDNHSARADNHGPTPTAKGYRSHANHRYQCRDID